MRVAVEAGGVLAEEVGVFVSIRIDQPRAFAAHDRERERRHMDDRARIAAGHYLRALLVQPARLGVAVGVPALRRGDEAGHIHGDGLAHGPAM